MASTFDGPPPGGPPMADTNGSTIQVRIITIVLTGINIFAAAAMAARILWDTRNACMKRRRSSRRGDLVVVEEIGGGQKEGDGGGGGGGKLGLGLEEGQRISGSGSSKKLIGGGGGGGGGGGEVDRKAWWEMIPAVDVFPLILAVTIFAQGAMFAVVEGEGLSMNVFRGNCRYLSEIAWVALWITPYIILSFTIETAIRALSQPRFQPRSGKAIVYCILFALVLTIFTWIPSRTMPEDQNQDICNGQLMSFVDQFAAGGLGVMVALLPIAVFMGGVVLMHLSKDVAIDRVEKMASSRTVYFMAINALQWVLMVPNYVLTAQGHPEYPMSELATVIANLGGIIASGFYIYLRTRAVPEENNDEPEIVHLGASRSAASEKELNIIISEPHDQRDDNSMNSRPALASIISEYYDHSISEVPRSPTASEYSELETISILRTPRTPCSPTSMYSRDRRSSRAPSLFSQYTTHSFKRLGDEINHMIAGLRSTDSPTLPKHISAPPTTKRKPASNYTIFPPNTDRPNTPAASAVSAPSTTKLQVPLPTRILMRPPTRPSRAAVPPVNMDRRQWDPKVSERVQSQRSDSTTHTLQIPKPVSRVNSTGNSPARPFEVAIPPRPDNGDAESFMEILIWKKDNETEQNRV